MQTARREEIEIVGGGRWQEGEGDGESAVLPPAAHYVFGKTGANRCTNGTSNTQGKVRAGRPQQLPMQLCGLYRRDEGGTVGNGIL